MGYLYYLKNLINGRIYVGKTIKSPKIVYRHYIKEEMKENPILFNEMKEYGKENFLFFIIGKFPNKTLNEWHSFYTRKFNSIGVDLTPEVNPE